jgi:hypothetical protein
MQINLEWKWLASKIIYLETKEGTRSTRSPEMPCQVRSKILVREVGGKVMHALLCPLTYTTDFKGTGQNLQLTRFTNRSAHLSFKAQRICPL